MLDILHHVYFFSRKFGKNPKKMCFCYWVLAITVIIIVMTMETVVSSDTGSDSGGPASAGGSLSNVACKFSQQTKRASQA